MSSTICFKYLTRAKLPVKFIIISLANLFAVDLAAFNLFSMELLVRGRKIPVVEENGV